MEAYQLVQRQGSGRRRAAALVAIIVTVLCVLKRRKRKEDGVELPASSAGQHTTNGTKHQQNMTGTQGRSYSNSRLSDLVTSAPPKQAFTVAHQEQEQVSEIDGPTRHEK